MVFEPREVIVAGEFDDPVTSIYLVEKGSQEKTSQYTSGNPVIASVDNADFCILVTEPTPFGLNDLDLAVKMIRTMQIPCGVVINRTDIGDDSVLRYCDNEEIPILMEILEDRHIAEIYSEGKLIVEALPNYKKDFHNLIEQIKKWNK